MPLVLASYFGLLCTQPCHLRKALKFVVKNVPLRNFNSWRQSSKWYHLLNWEISFNYQVTLCCSLLNVWFQCLFSFFRTGPCVEPQLFSLPCRQSDISSGFIITVANSFSSELAETWVRITSEALAFSSCSTDMLHNRAVRLGGVTCDKYLAACLDQLIPTEQTPKCEDAAGGMSHAGLRPDSPPALIRFGPDPELPADLRVALLLSVCGREWVS